MDIKGEIRELKRILIEDRKEDDGSPEIPLYFFEVDADGNFTKVPSILERICGFSKDELYLLSLQNVVLVEDRARVQEALERVLEGERIVVEEIEIFSEKTGSHPVELIILPLKKNGSTNGAWGAVKDIGSRKDMEMKLETASSIQKASMTFLRDYVSLMSREIRQPLTTILLTLEMMDSGFFGEMTAQQKEKIDQLMALTDRLKSILEEALSASKNIAEEIKLDRRMVSLRKVIRDVLREKQDLLKERNITVITNFPEGNINVPADRKTIVQVVSTLIDRSVEVSPRGGDILVELEKKGPFLQLSVADSGEGLSEEAVETLFDRIHIDRERESGHFKEGLNLYMAKRIIEKHGGRIWCESFPGLGSSMLFTLPIEKEEE